MSFFISHRTCVSVFNATLCLAFLTACGSLKNDINGERKSLESENPSSSDAAESQGVLSLSLPVEEKGKSPLQKVILRIKNESGFVLEKSFAYKAGQKIDVEKIPAGVYTLSLELHSSSGPVEVGTSKIEVQAKKIVQASVTLHPAGSNKGGISIEIVRPGVPSVDKDLCLSPRPAVLCHTAKSVGQCQVKVGEKLFSVDAACDGRGQLLERLCSEKISVTPELYNSFVCDGGIKPIIDPPPVIDPQPIKGLPVKNDSGVILDFKSVVNQVVGVNFPDAFAVEISGRVMLGGNSCQAAGVTAQLVQEASTTSISPQIVAIRAQVVRPKEERICPEVFAPVYANVNFVYRGTHSAGGTNIIVANVDMAGNDKLISIKK